jgi:hypothetical protein
MASDESKLDEMVDSQRHLLYVARLCDRDHVAVTSFQSGSEYPANLLSDKYGPPGEEMTALEITQATHCHAERLAGDEQSSTRNFDLWRSAA